MPTSTPRFRGRWAAIIVVSACLWPALARAADSIVPYRAVVAQTAAVLRERYLDQQLGAQLAAGLIEKESAGAFASATTNEEFAKQVTLAMQTMVPDLHLRMSYEPTREFVAGLTAEPAASATPARQVVRTGRIDGRDVATLARTNFAFDAIERLDGNIGYLRLSRFVPIDLSKPTVAAAFAFLGNSDAIIIDLRGNIGGSPDTVGYMLSHFFPAGAAPVLLHAAENRSQGIQSQVLTDPALGHARLSAAPLFLLIDSRSASAAEMFAYASQRLGRAVVVGETSSGAGNGARKHSVGGGFALMVSEWRALTGPGWERVGVKPDVPAGAADSLPTARRLALKALLAQPDLAADVRAERERAASKL